MYKAEYIPCMNAYRIFNAEHPEDIVAYEDSLDKAIKRWSEEDE